MNNGIVLNHHSLPFSSVASANVGILEFLKVLSVCSKFGLKVLLIDESQDKSLMKVELSSSYFVSDWFNQSRQIPDLHLERQKLRSLHTRQPMFEALDLSSLDNSVELRYPGASSGSPVFLAAYHFETYMVSFTTNEKWRQPWIQAWLLDLRTNNDEAQDHSLPNLADQASLQAHEPDLVHRRNNLIGSATDIWENRDSLFPNLTLLQNQIGNSLQSWKADERILERARDALFSFDEFCSKWKAGEYTGYRHEHLQSLGLAAKVSGESETVDKDPSLRKKRIFWLEDGREVYCENHIWLPGNYRLHFYPDGKEKRIYVAYLGPHLPTAKF